MAVPTTEERRRTLKLVEENWKTLYHPMRALCIYCYQEGQCRPDQDYLDAYSVEELQDILCELLKTGAASVAQLPGDHHPPFDS